MITDGQVTPDGFAINTSRSIQLHAPTDTDNTRLVPPQTQTHIGDLLSAKGVSWKWYSGGLNDAIAGRPDPLFQFHHQAPAFFANMAIGSANQVAHFQDFANLMSDIANNTLPQVVFYKPIGTFNLHPGYANITDGESHLATVVNALMASPAYKDMMIIITFDEHGGQWDHVAPPVRDKWGPGSRVPAIIISPFAKRGYIDHTQYDTSSILKTIEDRFGLSSLTSSDAGVKNLRNALQ
jgi:phospholipase C